MQIAKKENITVPVVTGPSSSVSEQDASKEEHIPSLGSIADIPAIPSSGSEDNGIYHD